jgi:uncharacterized protein YjiS (DUF1127 family)
MTILRDWSADAQQFAETGRQRATDVLLQFSGAVVKVLRVWRERQRERRELAFLCERDLRNIGVPREVVIDEARKWPWHL